jgi:hypothetical protein
VTVLWPVFRPGAFSRRLFEEKGEAEFWAGQFRDSQNRAALSPRREAPRGGCKAELSLEVGPQTVGPPFLARQASKTPSGCSWRQRN